MKRNADLDTRAVSEIVGAILLIAMTVLAASVVAVYVFSQPQAEPVDRAEILIWANDTMVFFQNLGGDALSEADLALYYNGIDQSFDSSSSWPFEPGDVITYTPASPPPTTNLSDSVYLIFTGFSSEGVLLDVLVEEGRSDRSSWVVTVPGPIPTATGGGPPTPPTPIEAGDLVWNYTNSDCSVFWQLGPNNGCIAPDEYFNFTVIEDYSWIMYTDGRKLLFANNNVSIQTTGNSKWMSYSAIGSYGLQLAFDDVKLYVDGVSVAWSGPNPRAVDITGANITKYSNVHSTIEVNPPHNPTWVTYWQNGTLIQDNSVQTPYDFTNIRPTETGLMLIDIRNTNPDRIYFIAKADVSPPPP